MQWSVRCCEGEEESEKGENEGSEALLLLRHPPLLRFQAAPPGLTSPRCVRAALRAPSTASSTSTGASLETLISNPRGTGGWAQHASTSR